MVEYVTRDEFEARVGVLEQEVEGEKIVTRYILDQTRRNGDDLAALKTRVDRVERKLDALDRKVDGLDRKFDGLDRKVEGLAKTLPTMIRDVMREVFAERDARG
jgi:predicted RNase H-like nuclease (RuvC/YqgF family)